MDTVATTTYFRDGGHVETNWGKLGEGEGKMDDEDEEDEPSDEDTFDDEAARKMTKMEEIELVVPVGVEEQMANMKVVHDNGMEEITEDKEKTCACFRDYKKLWCLACLASLIVGGLIAAIILKYGDFNSSFEDNVKGCH